MTDDKTKRYFKFLKKNDDLFGKLLKNKASKENGRKVAFYLTELYFISQSIVKLTKKVSETNLKLTRNDLNLLLGNLIDLRIEIYDKIADEIRDLKKPLNTSIDIIGKSVSDKPGDKSGANVARKIIRSSMKQIDINLRKIRYYSVYNKRKKKNSEMIRNSLKS